MDTCTEAWLLHEIGWSVEPRTMVCTHDDSAMVPGFLVFCSDLFFLQLQLVLHLARLSGPSLIKCFFAIPGFFDAELVCHSGRDQCYLWYISTGMSCVDICRSKRRLKTFEWLNGHNLTPSHCNRRIVLWETSLQVWPLMTIL